MNETYTLCSMSVAIELKIGFKKLVETVGRFEDCLASHISEV